MRLPAHEGNRPEICSDRQKIAAPTNIKAANLVIFSITAIAIFDCRHCIAHIALQSPKCPRNFINL